MKTAITVLVILALLTFMVPAFAASAASPPGNSQSGLARYDSNPGRAQAGQVGAQCGSGAASGSFGYFGKDNNLGIKSNPNGPGANGYQTGLNNSGVCGQRP